MRLIDAPVGLFMSKEGELCLKTEYIADWGVEAYIVSSGETYWGGAKTAEERNNLDVTPIEVAPVRNGHWRKYSSDEWICSECGYDKYCDTLDGGVLPPYCEECGAKMDLGK